jgi:DivIVA domain-containing protein
MRKSKRTQAEGEPQPGATRISPAEVQEREFRLAFRGYNERDVDVFLDEITEELSRLLGENRRLREQLEGKGPVPADPDHALLEADAIVLRAHEEAARILADAQRQAVLSEGPVPDPSITVDAEGLAHPAVPIVSTFIARERGFLQNMAALIQRHAEEVKQDIRRAKDAGLTAGLDRPADTAVPSSSVAPLAAVAVAPEESLGEQPEPIEDRPAEEPVDAEWVPEPDAAGVALAAEGVEPGGEPPAEDQDAQSWEAVAEAAWGSSAAPARTPADAQEGRAEVEPEDAGPDLGRPAVDAASDEVDLRRDEPVAGLVAGASLVHAAVRVGDAGGVGGDAREEDDPPTLQELFWGEG